MSHNVDPRMKKDTVSATTSLAQDDLAGNVSNDSTTERSGDDMAEGTLTTESTSVETTTDETPKKEVFVTLTLNRQPKNFHELAMYFKIHTLLREQLKGDDYRLKGQIYSYALEICNGSLKKKSFYDLSESFGIKKDTLHKMLPDDSETAGTSNEFTLSILHDCKYPFADERNCFLNKISLEELVKSWSSNTLFKEPVCQTCALYFIKSNTNEAMSELTRNRDSETAGQPDDIDGLSLGMDAIMLDSKLKQTFAVYGSSSKPGMYHFFRCQRRSIDQAIENFKKKDPKAREVFRKDDVSNAFYIFNNIKERLKKIINSRYNEICFFCDIKDEELVNIIKDVLKNN